jgi:hypothetical protein
MDQKEAGKRLVSPLGLAPVFECEKPKAIKDFEDKHGRPATLSECIIILNIQPCKNVNNKG